MNLKRIEEIEALYKAFHSEQLYIPNSFTQSIFESIFPKEEQDKNIETPLEAENVNFSEFETMDHLDSTQNSEEENNEKSEAQDDDSSENIEKEPRILHIAKDFKFHFLNTQEKLKHIQKLKKECNEKDYILLSFPLKDLPSSIIEQAKKEYDCEKTFLNAFCEKLNDLLNIEISADQFEIFLNYNPENGNISCFLIPTENQKLYSNVWKEELCFNRLEPIKIFSKQLFGLKGIDFIIEHTGLKKLHKVHDKEKSELYILCQ